MFLTRPIFPTIPIDRIIEFEPFLYISQNQKPLLISTIYVYALQVSLTPQNMKIQHWVILEGFLLKSITIQAFPNNKLKVKSHSLDLSMLGLQFFSLNY